MRSFADNNGTLIFFRRSATIFLVILIAWQAAGLTWKIVGPAQDMNGSVKSALPGDAVDSKAGKIGVKKRASVSEVPIFGTSDRVVAARRPTSKDDAPLTSLALILKGVVMMDPVKRALAIITEKGKPDQEKLYGIGDSVPGNAVVDEIFFDRVILRRGGVMETLLLLGNESAASPVRAGRNIKPMGDGVNWQIDRGYWKQRLADIPSLAREIGVEVYRENNVQKGYKLLSARGSKLLRDLGLQPGDVLHEVNGVPLNSVHDGLDVYQKITNATEVRVIFSRNGKREARVYRIGS